LLKQCSWHSSRSKMQPARDRPKQSLIHQPGLQSHQDSLTVQSHIQDLWHRRGDIWALVERLGWKFEDAAKYQGLVTNFITGIRDSAMLMKRDWLDMSAQEARLCQYLYKASDEWTGPLSMPLSSSNPMSMERPQSGLGPFAPFGLAGWFHLFPALPLPSLAMLMKPNRQSLN
jgi:hypothetical protein